MTAPSTPETIRAEALRRYVDDPEFHARAYSAGYLARALSPHRSPGTTEQTRRERDLAIEAAAVALVLAELPPDVLVAGLAATTDPDTALDPRADLR